MRRVTKILGLAWTVVWLLAAGFFGLLFHETYWRWRGCFNEEGRCWTGEVVRHDTSMFQLLPALLCLVFAIIGLCVVFRSDGGPGA